MLLKLEQRPRGVGAWLSNELKIILILVKYSQAGIIHGKQFSPTLVRKACMRLWLDRQAVQGMALRTLLPRLPSWGSGLRADNSKDSQFSVVRNSQVWVDNMTANLQLPINFTHDARQLPRTLNKARKKRFSYWENEESPLVGSSR